MSDKMEFRLVRPEDFEDLKVLYKKVYQRGFSSKYWDWKYFHNPAGEHGMFVAVKGGQVVGETGHIPVKFKIKDEHFMASQAVDITVHPDHQTGGTFFKMARKTIAKCVNGDCMFMYGFSVPITLKLCTKLLKFQSMFPVWRWLLILNPEPYLEKKINIKFLSGVIAPFARLFARLRLKRMYKRPSAENVVEIRRFDERFDRFWERRQKDYGIMVARDSTYLNWRYIDIPDKNYKIYAYVSDEEIKGFTVLTNVTDEINRGVILELVADPQDTAMIDYLMSLAIDYFYRERTDAAMMWLPRGIPLVKHIEKWGFIGKETHHNLIVRPCEENETYTEYFMDPDNWYFTMGDSDYH